MSSDGYVTCPSCGSRLPAGSSLCIHCGANVRTGEESSLSILAKTRSDDYDRLLRQGERGGPDAWDPELEAAISHTRRACIAGMVAACLTFVSVLLALGGVELVPGLEIDAWYLADVAILLGLSFGVYRKSRVCGALLLVYALASYAHLWAVTGRIRILPFVFMYFYVQGIRGAFAYHALRPPAEGKSRRRKWLVVGGAVVGTLAAGIVVLLAFIGAVAPETSVVAGAQMRKSHLAKIRSLGLLEPGEEVRYFYSDALFNIEDGHYFLTDRKLVIYSREFDEPAIVVPFREIASVTAEWNDSFFEDSSVLVELDDGQVVWFPLSSEKGLDRVFVEEIKRHVGGD